MKTTIEVCHRSQGFPLTESLTRGFAARLYVIASARILTSAGQQDDKRLALDG
jgi:hypothetical protein